jgi:proteasome lid subunit RPN8/RPN11
MLRRLFGRRKQPPRFVVREVESQPRLLIARSCFDGLMSSLAQANAQHHEGVALLLGHSHGGTALAIHSVRPRASTGRGHFQIPAGEMARVIALATDLDLHIVAQVHTHPGEAFHSDGDEEGANIRYEGLFSLVIPEYGRFLPSLQASALYIYRSPGWDLLETSALTIVDPVTIL